MSAEGSGPADSRARSLDTRELAWIVRHTVDEHRPEPNFPMPNDSLYIDKRGVVTVVASVYYTDEEALVLLLHNEPPFFEVAQLLVANEGLLSLGTFENIVPAVDEYKDSGGDY
jgi:hypothetical protein